MCHISMYSVYYSSTLSVMLIFFSLCLLFSGLNLEPISQTSLCHPALFSSTQAMQVNWLTFTRQHSAVLKCDQQSQQSAAVGFRKFKSHFLHREISFSFYIDIGLFFPSRPKFYIGHEVKIQHRAKAVKRTNINENFLRIKHCNWGN